MGDWNRLEELFSEAAGRAPGERAEFLARHCGDDQALRHEVESLLAAHDATGGVLDRPAFDGGAPHQAEVAAPERESALQPGTRLGPWRLAEWIGRGGAGEVYAATRADGAFEQRVAIKVLRHEAAAEASRFHAERHLLAQFEHPGIGRLLDGGVTADGRPYAVLEFVEGRSLTEHCRATASRLDARLGLFGQVCHAVAYAHRHLVVHRDLKPANILVSADGRVKLLDFGIAKLLATDSAAAADLTQAPLTLDYAAPEQLTGAPVTTATDVYALGVVLFELLTGNRPWRSAELPVARAVRLVLDEPAPRASQRVDPSMATLVPPRRLEGDLDAIVARCLRKSPAERYPTVEALWQDVERHLRHEPVSARESARLYRLGRFLYRHRWPAAAAAALVVSLAAGLTAFAWQAERAERERDIARRAASREEAVRSQLIRLFRSSLAESGGRGSTPISAKAMLDRSAQRVIEQYRDDPPLAGTLVETLTDLYGALGDVEGQRPLLESFLATAASAGPEADPRAVALARQKLAHLELVRGNPQRAAELLPLAEAVWAAAPERFREERLEGLMMRGLLARSQGDLDGSIATFREAIGERLAISGRVHRETANLYNSLAISLTAANRAEDALAAHREALAIHQELGLGEDLDALVILGNTGTLAFRSGRVREAEEILATAYRKQRALAGDSAAVAAAMGLHGAALRIRGRAAEALPILDEALAMAVRFTGPASPLSVQNRLFRAEALAGTAGTGTTAAIPAARRVLRENLDIARAQYGDAHVLALRMRLALARLELTANQPQAAAEDARALLPQLATIKGPSAAFQAHDRVILGDALLRLGRPAEAVEPLRAAVEQRESMLWSGSWELAEARARLGEALVRTGDPGGRALLDSAAAALRTELGPEHPETQRVLQVLATTH